MREIKFRAWDINGKCMLDWLTMRQTAFNRSEGRNEYGLMYRVMTSPDFIKMQFTGLKDRNGKDIFEGDVLEIKTQSGRIATQEKFPPTTQTIKHYADKGNARED